MEALLAFKRAGADGILTYYALDAAQWLKEPEVLQESVVTVSSLRPGRGEYERDIPSFCRRLQARSRGRKA